MHAEGEDKPMTAPAMTAVLVGGPLDGRRISGIPRASEVLVVDDSLGEPPAPAVLEAQGRPQRALLAYRAGRPSLPAGGACAYAAGARRPLRPLGPGEVLMTWAGTQMPGRGPGGAWDEGLRADARRRA